MKIDIHSMCLCAMFSIIIAIGAFIKVPISLVPITLQTLFVILAGLILKEKLALISVGLYIMIGLIGLPVFANGGGIGYVLQPSFGYLLGFLPAVWFVGKFTKNHNSTCKTVIICLLAMLIIYGIGMLYFSLIQNIYYGKEFTNSWMFYYLFLVYLPGDVISCVVAVAIYKRIPKKIMLLKEAV